MRDDKNQKEVNNMTYKLPTVINIYIYIYFTFLKKKGIPLSSYRKIQVLLNSVQKGLNQ